MVKHWDSFLSHSHCKCKSYCWSLGCRSVDCGKQCVTQCGIDYKGTDKCIYNKNRSCRFYLPPHLCLKFQYLQQPHTQLQTQVTFILQSIYFCKVIDLCSSLYTTYICWDIQPTTVYSLIIVTASRLNYKLHQ